jgi:Protein of unknown function (DUF4031)
MYDDAIWHWQGMKWCHLVADDADELHRFAARLGIKRNRVAAPYPRVQSSVGSEYGRPIDSIGAAHEKILPPLKKAPPSFFPPA